MQHDAVLADIVDCRIALVHQRLHLVHQRLALAPLGLGLYSGAALCGIQGAARILGLFPRPLRRRRRVLGLLGTYKSGSPLLFPALTLLDGLDYLGLSGVALALGLVRVAERERPLALGGF